MKPGVGESGATPLVTVIVPSYQHAAFVEQSIRSVWNQTYSATELIVVDDCSTDGSWELLTALSKEQAFTLLRNERNLGLNATLERGLALARGEFVSILASDDVILPYKLERQVAYLQETGKDAVYANAEVLDLDGTYRPVDLGDVSERFRRATILPHVYCDDTRSPLLQSALIRRRVMLELSPIRNQFESDDWVMLIKMLERYDVGFLDEVVFVYRQHEANSFKDYWWTLPSRVQVVARALPQEFRTKALGKLLSSHAQYLKRDGRTGPWIRFMLASFALDPAPRRFPEYVRRQVKRAARKLQQVVSSPDRR